MIKRVTVYCGSRSGVDNTLVDLLEDLATLFAQRGITLIYGGGSIGLMGILADKLLSKKGKVIGVIPFFLNDMEVGHKGLDELILVNSMHERKEKMAELTEAFLILPGGIGTMDEFFEILTWKQLGLHAKPIAVLNHNDYYEHLKTQLSGMVEKGFLGKSGLQLFNFYDSLLEYKTQFLDR
jgi:uncharacterized protein (TIGR00730 family)